MKQSEFNFFETTGMLSQVATGFEGFGNKLLSQWIAAQSKLTILEEMQVERSLAYA